MRGGCIKSIITHICSNVRFCQFFNRILIYFLFSARPEKERETYADHYRFFKNNQVAIVDFCFNAGYVIAAVVSSIIILFFCYLYLEKRHGFIAKEAFNYLFTKILDYFVTIALVYFVFVSGIKIGLDTSLVIFYTMPVYVFALVIVPIFIFATLWGIVVGDLFDFILQRRIKKHDIIKDTDIPDIPDTDSSGICDDTAVSDD